MHYFHSHKFWFYIRKAIFQGLIPIVLGFFTFYDLIDDIRNTNHFRFYIMSSLILLIYSQLRIMLEYIFSICSETIILKKKFNQNLNNGQLFFNGSDSTFMDTHFICVTKRIYKLTYSSSNFFILIDKICWFMGIDSPILIPLDVIKTFNYNVANNDNGNDSDQYEMLNKLVYDLFGHNTDLSDVNSDTDSEINTRINTLSDSELDKPLIDKSHYKKINSINQIKDLLEMF
jgi:hypothetical protein